MAKKCTAARCRVTGRVLASRKRGKKVEERGAENRLESQCLLAAVVALLPLDVRRACGCCDDLERSASPRVVFSFFPPLPPPVLRDSCPPDFALDDDECSNEPLRWTVPSSQ